MECQLGADNTFGPQVQGCRDNFDFTLLFEQSFFQIAPCALLLLSVPLRTLHLRKQNVKTLRTVVGPAKQLAIAALACTQLALLIVWSLAPMYRTRASIPAACLSFLASVTLLMLSSMEHSRSVRPSLIINAYLLFSLLFDIPQARTLWLRSGPRSLPGVYTAGIVAKTIVLVLEAGGKKRFLSPTYRLLAPEALAGLYNRTVLWWLNPLFWKGFTSLINIDSLYPIDAEMAADNAHRRFLTIWPKYKGKSKRCLVWAMLACHALDLASVAAPRLVLSAFKMSQPLLINRVTDLLAQRADATNINEGRGLIGATVLIYVGMALATVLYKRQLDRFLTKLRATQVTALYAKVLELPADKVQDNAAITLINTDVQRIHQSLQRFEDIFATPIEIAVAIFLLQRQIGVACIAPIAMSLFISIIAFFNSSLGIKYQKQWLASVSDRVAYTSSVLGFAKGVKMLGLSEYLIDRIQGLRVKELRDYAAYRKFATYRNTFANIPTASSPLLALSVFAATHPAHVLNPTRAFTTLSLVTLLSQPVSDLIQIVPLVLAAIASFDRIQAFLMLEEGESLSAATSAGDAFGATELSVLAPKVPDPERTILALRAASVRLGKEGKDLLQDIDLVVKAHTLTMLVGPVGSGKSTLLRLLVGDVKASSGQRQTSPLVNDYAYCAQDPWIPNGTVKELVVGYSGSDDVWLHTVLEATALHVDVTSFPQGVHTIIGTNGLALSGGQKQRLTLARAIYSRRSVLVVDDVLSGLDAATAQHVFSKVFGREGICRSHSVTAVLATHSLQYLHEADNIIALDDTGRVLEQGSYQDLQRLGGYVNSLRSGSKIGENANAAEAAVLEPQKESAAAAKKADMQADLARRTGDTALYGYYLRSIGWRLNIILVVACTVFTFGLKFPDLWVRWWSEDEASGLLQRPRALWIGIYALVVVVGISSVAAHIWAMLVHAVPKSSGKLHEQLLHAVMRAPYKFFVQTDAGVTLNRFSNDMSLIEMDLAGAYLQVQSYGAVALASTALILAGSRYAAATLPAILGVVYIIQKFYLRTSRQIRFMNLEAQAPLMTHCQETLSGGTTIRAFGWERQSHEKCLELLDNSQRSFYLMLCIQRWLGLVLDLLTAGTATIVVAMGMELRGTASAGSVGVSLLNILTFNQYLTVFINAWTLLETSLGAVARIKNFEAETISENKPDETVIPSESWPDHGNLRISGIHASYDESGPDVLKNLSVDIPAGTKVGICGRSGSGKSSLVLTLLRLLDTSSGATTLDLVDLATVPRQLLRERITALPQETFTVPGSVRENIDPLSNVQDSAIESALDKVGLLDAVVSCGGLDTTMTDLALSHGQMQLFAVARTLLRPSKLLVLDEMSSSVDTVTEEKMMAAIQETFKKSTIIAVAHRLKTIVDYDLVLVMDSGRIVEMGPPRELLRKEDGPFRALWEKNGH